MVEEEDGEDAVNCAALPPLLSFVLSGLLLRAPSHLHVAILLSDPSRPICTMSALAAASAALFWVQSPQVMGGCVRSFRSPLLSPEAALSTRKWEGTIAMGISHPPLSLFLNAREEGTGESIRSLSGE